MGVDLNRQPAILGVEDVEETREGIQRLLLASGYMVSTAKDETEAVLKAELQPPDLVLISLGLDAVSSAAMGRRIREDARLDRPVPVVIFCVPGLPEGAEEAIADNTYLTRPDNFDQLRTLLKRLLAAQPPD